MKKQSNDIYKVTNWRTYLDPLGNKRVERFLKYRGTHVMAGLIKSIEEASDSNAKSLMVLVHPNVSSLVQIMPIEYDELLEHCLEYLQDKEEYELCADIIRIRKKINSDTKKKK